MPEYAVVHRIVQEMNHPPHKVKSRARDKDKDPRFNMIGKVKIHVNGCANEEGNRPTVSLHQCKDSAIFETLGKGKETGAAGEDSVCSVCTPDEPLTVQHDKTKISREQTKSGSQHINDLNIEGRLMPVVQRGKELAFVVGKYAFRVCLSLEGHGFWLPTSMYHDIIGAGTVSNTGNTMYRIPRKHWRGPPGIAGRIRIIMSFECATYTWIFADHTAAMTFHVKACKECPSEADLQVGSKFWGLLWSKSHGPDLVQQPEEALRVLEAWRVTNIKKRSEKPIFFSVKETQTVFNGYGAQETTDMLFWALIMPIMPTYAVCATGTTWERFKSAVFEYQQERTRLMDAKCSESKLSYVSGDDPFRFQTSAHHHFAGHVSVFRRAWVKVPLNHLQKAKELGLFNWHATLEDTGQAHVRKGESLGYQAHQQKRNLPHYQRKGTGGLTETQTYILVRNRELTVRNARKGLVTAKSYTPFSARFNPLWWGSDEAPSFVKKDLLEHHNLTTVGPYSFRVFVSANWTMSTVKAKATTKGLKTNKKALTGRRRVTGFIRPRTLEILKRT
ncbi:hypothetical protein CVT24_002693 [Panaeolus cyanescens]|uniref:Uncharacterized protein n=1 Tax=Panaeolus cyanescens TaxID=181874 RepID=A0A409YY95_9AGAR|nr:hypothetical protein CVT24_002693 [Panaeolus cyanescens]